MSTPRCTHLESISVSELPEPPLQCEECVKVGGEWVHLRMCVQCGKIGCCDNSPSRHATRHFADTGHPLIRSAEPHEAWLWCYVDQVPIVGIEG